MTRGIARIAITSSEARTPDGAIHSHVLPYVEAVRRYGGDPVLVENDPAHVERVLAEVEGVLVGGGTDIDPQRYGGRPDYPLRPAAWHDARDRFELALIRAARARGIPTLCICRGLQVANVAFGGTLIEHIPDELGPDAPIDHRQTNAEGIERCDYAPGHEVELDPASRLARLLGRARFPTNSLHHQAVREVAPALRSVGRTSDGVIEALDADFAHPFFYAVQWHPEELDDEISARLFAGLVAAAEGASAAR